MPTFPYDPDWTGRSMVTDKRIISSISVGGARKSRIKGNKKVRLDLRFENRTEAEYNAAEAFWVLYYPETSFTFVDSAFATPRSLTVVFTGAITHQANAYNDVTYSFQVEEI